MRAWIRALLPPDPHLPMTTTAAPLLTLRFALKRDGTPVLSVTRRDGSVAWQLQSGFFPLLDLTHFAV